MLTITLRKSAYLTSKRLAKQFKFFRDLGVSRMNSCKLLYKLQRGHTVFIHTFSDLKKVAERYSRVEIDAYKVGFVRNVFAVSTRFKDEARCNLVQKIKADWRYENYTAAVYVTKGPE